MIDFRLVASQVDRINSNSREKRVILLGRGNFRSIKQEETLATRCRLLHASDAVCIRVWSDGYASKFANARECYLANQC